MSYTATDLFCGAGGSGLGAAAAGIDLSLAANHSAIAIETHAANFPDTEHDQADISQVDPRRYRASTFLWASPECTNHSGARGRAQRAQRDLFTRPDPAAERSRATMWDVPRFAECHRYPVVLVENVVEAAGWEMWPAWLHAMQCLGYRHQVVSLNSMHAPAERAPRAPQSRDRLYVAFTRKDLPRPDLEPRPPAWCPRCGQDVAAAQWWKNRRRIGRYRQAYRYRCPDCRDIVEPFVLPAAAAIDWTIPGQRIGDRDRPLKPATLDRIRHGLEHYATEPVLVPAFAARASLRPVHQPLGTQTTRQETALVVPYLRQGRAAPTVSAPLPTMTTVDPVGIAFIAELRGGGSTHRPVTEPLATLTASGTHHMLVRNNGSGGAAGQMCTPASEPMRTLTTAGHQSLVGWPHPAPAVQDCTFRMLQVPEIAAGMAFSPDYALRGTKRQQVAQLGNAVTPCASEWLYRRCLDTLDR